METNLKQKGGEEGLTRTEHLLLQTRRSYHFISLEQQPHDTVVTFSEL